MFIKQNEIPDQTHIISVPFCKDCNSQNIEIVKTCKECGSHNISSDIFDKRSKKLGGNYIDVNVYKCDKCGKEFNLDEDEFCNIISICDGEFLPYNTCSELDKKVELKEDLCRECRDKLVEQLNKDFDNLTETTYIEKVLKNRL